MAEVAVKFLHEKRKKLLCFCSIVEECMHELLRCCLRQFDPNVDPDVSLANSFRQNINTPVLRKKISSLRYPCNACKVYEPHGSYVVRNEMKSTLTS